uniref:Precorrin-3B C17-methyltransferase n=1 Tax=Candidatus Kentrum sp. SD TaxID=2126332 RepID=A0A450YS68_9GAMM|nr:MAG: precorrin-3B C17-methyltransferase [Candidatus Kentron sp. SD]VFK79826.1 MAG: precorrin-3B C17-methyltransferase [Candidatus Kentron sp. SD]
MIPVKSNMKVMLGIGCDRGTPMETLEKAVGAALAQIGATLEAVQGIASIEAKRDEEGLLALAENRGWPLLFYGANELSQAPVPNPSEVVRRHMGTPAVAEAAALLAAGINTADLLVEKIKLRGQDGKNATVSVARITEASRVDKVGRPHPPDAMVDALPGRLSTRQGRILIVGIGPGSAEYMTIRARQAITEAEVVIGYSNYIALLGDLEGKKVIQKGMTQETDRCLEAMRHAETGMTVALISSGDAGIYGMASLVYEVLFKAGWKPREGIEVEVVPGCPALSSCASLVGAPLGHDFCAISLSDLLTPWPLIARRLESAARADFVLALYNPKSKRRTDQIVTARRILLRHRDPNTPVAIINSAYRDGQSIQITTLWKMLHCDIGMLSTVLIGNSQTFLREDLMITPRGYAGKYPNLIGSARDGERAGRSLRLGLEEWHNAVRAWIAGNPEMANPHAAARFFDAPLGEILTAIAEASVEESAGGISAYALDPSRLDGILSVIGQSQGQDQHLSIEIRGNGSIMQGEITKLEQDGDRIFASREALHVHVPLAAVATIWLIPRSIDSEIYLLDKNGDLLLSVRYRQNSHIALQPFRLPTLPL